MQLAAAGGPRQTLQTQIAYRLQQGAHNGGRIGFGPGCHFQFQGVQSADPLAPHSTRAAIPTGPQAEPGGLARQPFDQGRWNRHGKKHAGLLLVAFHPGDGQGFGATERVPTRQAGAAPMAHQHGAVPLAAPKGDAFGIGPTKHLSGNQVFGLMGIWVSGVSGFPVRGRCQSHLFLELLHRLTPGARSPSPAQPVEPMQQVGSHLAGVQGIPLTEQRRHGAALLQPSPLGGQQQHVTKPRR